MSRIHDRALAVPPTASTPPAAGRSLGIDVAARIEEIDLAAMDRARLARVREQLVRFGYGSALLSDPLNIRYAIGVRNMQIWTMHAPGRYVFIPVEGPVVLFEFAASMHLAEAATVVDDVRPSVSPFYFLAGPRRAEKSEDWARDVIDLGLRYGGKEQRMAVDRCEPWNAAHLIAAGFSLFDAQEPLELARMIKTPEELKCLQLSVDVADLAVNRMRATLTAGMTENELWAVLHETNIAHDGEWIECRLLCSGPRTNPWFQESGNRVIEAGDMVAFDTDMVGPMGYLADISRAFVCPGKRPTGEQRRLYDIALDQVMTNVALIEPGMSFEEFGAKCWPVPDQFVPNRYMMMIHGAGLVDEAPIVAYAADFEESGYSGTFEEGMVVCVESFIGEVGGKEGVKLEEQVLVTAGGAKTLSSAPLVDALSID
ncbi:Xaa-Pro aminopeptidase [Quadrisphaera granulorum]|uniref:Xaa-Pro aminopeptidase n=1 Tax=Quadrisphaera granulorum TaxID=317664 RepID=A0A316A8W4_9ACTN|nr:Xaa-Pro peptidase family protein [Quadrisphaera granulorum]PWJ53879.1 Xaa-Pro aminopeptidase [Quadrisphaera granulorum]SZE96636.1 Xaa-Pro aminopeptidase [Quadrisphaera granulorum]